MKKKVLFVCTKNSARSQMAEAWMNHLCGDCFEARSAGLEPGELHPQVVQAMAEVDVDIAHHRSKGVLDLFRQEHAFDYIIAVCDLTELLRCPVFPGRAERLHWPLPDPVSSTDDEPVRLERVREVRDQIRTKIEAWREVWLFADCCQ